MDLGTIITLILIGAFIVFAIINAIIVFFGDKTEKAKNLNKQIYDLENTKAKLETDYKNLYKEYTSYRDYINKYRKERDEIINTVREYHKIKNEIAPKEQYLKSLEGKITHIKNKKETLFANYQNAVDELQTDFEKLKTDLINTSEQSYPWFADLYSDYIYVHDMKRVDKLKNKKRPALKSAEQVAIIAKEKREINKKLKLLQTQMSVYENLFPWLEEFKEIPVQEAVEATEKSYQISSEYDILKNWLSPEEYSKLDNIQKYQLALDRYKKRKKSNWQLGIEYERYVGYLLEEQDFDVIYNGAVNGLEDMGKDIIAQKDGSIYVIQCKRWSKEKTIHEKHIFQLYGTTVLEAINNPQKNVIGVFITTTSLSETAILCADFLNIKCICNFEMKEYPLIKCNISKRDNEKIYHLPFDLQYDNVKIEKEKQEFYAFTVEEAENAGFRRSYKWLGNNE